jgi:3-dehydroquinate synthase
VRTLEVALGARAYPIHIGRGLAAEPDVLARFVANRQVLLVTNDVVGPLYARETGAAIAASSASLQVLVIPDGEAHKTMETMAAVIDALVEHRMNRDALLVALGGGVTGDLAGFAAACYQRGIDWLQIPTTLLAQVDSSVGGKTAVNHPAGKNLIGAFHQPIGVLADIATLATLDERHYRAGLAEVIKYGLIADAVFFDWLEDCIGALGARDEEALEVVIERCCAIKADVVARDEEERSGMRALLNLGHTFGHGIERALGFGGWLHGEAVAAGMAMAGEMSVRLGWLDDASQNRIVSLLHAAGLPVTPPPVGAQVLLDHMRLDKKTRAGQLNLVLLEAIGAALVTADFPESVLMETLGAADG